MVIYCYLRKYTKTEHIKTVSFFVHLYSYMNGGTMKNDAKRSKIPLAAGLIFLAAGAVWALTRIYGCSENAIPGATNEQRISYIQSFGWDPGITHSAVENIRIPTDFDDVYEEYNDLQRRQGFDLRRYRAHTVKRFTYELVDTMVPLNAELLVENGIIIGADIVSPTASGFQGALAVDRDAQN